jgi:hypothetical protein
MLGACRTVALAHVFVHKDREWAFEITRWPEPARGLCCAAILLLVVSFDATDAAPFIYFQFSGGVSERTDSRSRDALIRISVVI